MLQASGAGTGKGCRICPSAALLPACPAGAGVQLKDKDKKPESYPKLSFSCALVIASTTVVDLNSPRRRWLSMCDTSTENPREHFVSKDAPVPESVSTF